MDLYNKSAASINVGQRLRTLREERGTSMRALARRSGLSANALSMIERGLTSPSVSTLTKLSNALEVPITALFRAEPERHDIVYVKAAERPRVPFQRGLWESLGGETFTGRMESFSLTLESGASSGPHGILHSGHEMFFCLRGKIEVDVDKHRYVLEPGDTLMYTANLIHRWRNPGNVVASAVVVISGFEESESPSEYHLASSSANKKEEE